MKKGLKGLVLLFTAVMGCFLMAACNSELPQLEAINGNDGQDGKDGKDGLSIIWKGALDEAPAEPELNWAYYNKNDGCSYIYNGSEWNLLAKAGKNGTDGMNGTNDANLAFLCVETSFIDDPLVPHNEVAVSIRTGSAPIEKMVMFMVLYLFLLKFFLRIRFQILLLQKMQMAYIILRQKKKVTMLLL